jgi:hypothetical protein
VARRRTTFGKLQRDRDKQAKARAKIERKAARAEEASSDDDDAGGGEVDQAAVLAQLAALHASYDEGEISLEDFEARRDELRNSLRID